MSHNNPDKSIRFGNKSKFPSILLYLIAIVSFFIIYDLNRLYPTYIDDWDYSFIYYTGERLGSIFDVIPSMKTHYTMWGGRLVVHTILQELLYFGEPWNNILNSLAFIAYISFIYLIANKNTKTKPSLLLFIILMTWFVQADLGETILWLTGSANYLWGTTIILAFLYPYYNYFTGKLYNSPSTSLENKSVSYNIMFFIAGVIAGWTNENMVVALGCMLIFFLFIIWKKERKVEKWSLWGLGGVALGAILMFIAPGNFKRYIIELKLRGIEGKPDISFYLENIQTLFNGILEYLIIPLAIYALLLLIFLFTNPDKNKKKVILTSLIFLCGCFIATAAMAASPVFPPRAWFGVISLFVIATAIIYANLDFSKIYIRISAWAIIIFGVMMFISTYTEGRQELKRIRAIVDDREKQINEQKANNVQDIIVITDKFEKRDDLIIPKMYDFPADTTHWMLQAYKHYHQIKSISLKDASTIDSSGTIKKN